MKKRITLEQQYSAPENDGQNTYLVKKAVNTLHPLVGATLSKQDVQEFCNNVNYNVTIVSAKL